MSDSNLMEKIVSLAKRRGFVFPGSEIYGGLAGTFDYGPLGVVLKENVERLWLQMFRDDRDDMYGIDSAILMNPKIWEASGHIAGFSDPLVECEKCKKPDFFIHTYTAYTGAAPEAPWGIAVEAGTGGGVREAEETPTASSFSAGGTRREESGEAEPFRKESGL